MLEENFCNFLGWENCTSTMILKRGGVSSFLINDSLHKTDVLRNVKFLHREKSPYQEIRVYDSLAMGRILVLDGEVQISTDSLGEDDLYTQNMSGLVVAKDKNYDHVIIIGGGDLVVAAYVLEKYPNVKNLTLCEIDERVSEVTKQFFEVGETCKKAIQKGRLNLVHKSGAHFIEELVQNGKENTVGAVIVDCTDFELNEDSIAAELYTPSFYENIYKLLIPGCGFSQHISGAWYAQAFMERASKGGFRNIEVFDCETPEYGMELPLVSCFKDKSPLQKEENTY